jgi:hypothetical protein
MMLSDFDDGYGFDTSKRLEVGGVPVYEGRVRLIDTDEPDYQHKFDALYAALYELTDDDTRDRVLARAKELEAEQDDE